MAYRNCDPSIMPWWRSFDEYLQKNYGLHQGPELSSLKPDMLIGAYVGYWEYLNSVYKVVKFRRLAGTWIESNLYLTITDHELDLWGICQRLHLPYPLQGVEFSSKPDPRSFDGQTYQSESRQL